jgi:membrane-associated protein
MNRTQFFMYDLIGASSWAILITLLGYWFGSRIPDLDKYIAPVILIVMLISFGPMVWHIIRDAKARRALRDRFATLLRRKATDIDPDTKN